MIYIYTIFLSLILSSCFQMDSQKEDYEFGTFGYDSVYLMNRDSNIVILSDGVSSKIIVSPKYQGRVFTSTFNGLSGKSLGWINYDFIDSGVIDEHFNCYGGENRLWIGPEGGKFSVFFRKGEKQEMPNWRTPPEIDVESWNIQSKSEESVSFVKEIELENYNGIKLKSRISREVRLIKKNEIKDMVGECWNDSIKCVAYKTINGITNLSTAAWTKDTGALCLWLLDMFPASEDAYTIVPYNCGNDSVYGYKIKSDYFSDVPENRLFNIENKAFVFKTDANFRSKIGLGSKRSKGLAGNYDFKTKCLTVIVFDVDSTGTYLNQEWGDEKEPFIGDVFNAYNDGPQTDGVRMGNFHELESSSHALFLKPNESDVHIHSVYHFYAGDFTMNSLMGKFFGLSFSQLNRLLNYNLIYLYEKV